MLVIQKRSRFVYLVLKYTSQIHNIEIYLTQFNHIIIKKILKITFTYLIERERAQTG